MVPKGQTQLEGDHPVTPHQNSATNQEKCDCCKIENLPCTLLPGTVICLQCTSRDIHCTFAGRKKSSKSEEDAVHDLMKMLKENNSQEDVGTPISRCVQKSHYIGPTSAWDTKLLGQLHSEGNISLSATTRLQTFAPNVHFLMDDRKLDAKLSTKIENLIYPNGPKLIEIFFHMCHPYLPILHELSFWQNYSVSYKEVSPALLACIYSLALQWWDFHPKLLGFPRPRVTHELNRIAYEAFISDLEAPSLSSIQAGILLLYTRPNNLHNWVICSNIVTMSEELGLPLDCSSWKLPAWEKSLRKRLAWAVWCHDKWTALIESRQSHIVLGKTWMIDLPKTEDFDQILDPVSQTDLNLKSSTDPAEGLLIFQHMTSLSIILDEIMATFYTEGAIEFITDIEEILSLAKPLQLKLRDWYQSLPQKLLMTAFIPGKLSANATIILQYFVAEITLHRKIILNLLPNAPAELVEVCRTAAKTRLLAAIEFVGDLKEEHISAFWYCSSMGNLMSIASFAALLYVTSRTEAECAIFKQQLQHYLWILKVGSKTFDKKRHALRNMYILLSHIPNLIEGVDGVKITDTNIQRELISMAEDHQPTRQNSATTQPKEDNPLLKKLKPNTQESQQNQALLQTALSKTTTTTPTDTGLEPKENSASPPPSKTETTQN